MQNLIIAVSLALVLGSFPCHATGNQASDSQVATNATSVDGSSAPVALNTTSKDSLAVNATSPAISTTKTAYVVKSPNSSNSSVLNTTPPISEASALSANSTVLTGDHSTSSNSANSGVYYMNQNIYWENSNFSIYDKNGTVAYQITNQYANGNLSAKEFIVEDSITGEKKLRINAHVKACGFAQTYEADDGTTFRLDTRAFLSDRWYIKNNSTEYVYKRGALSLEGNIVENERIVAEVSIHKNSTAKSISKTQLTLTSDGSIPPWDLIALMAVVKTRVNHCGY